LAGINKSMARYALRLGRHALSLWPLDETMALTKIEAFLFGGGIKRISLKPLNKQANVSGLPSHRWHRAPAVT